MMHTVKQISGGILWANLHLLFWLSMIPFATAWIGENHFAPLPMMLYGIVLLLCALAYFILQYLIMKKHGPDSVLSKAIGKDSKGKLSPVFYILGIIASNYSGLIAGAFYVLVAIMWLIPDKRIERILDHSE